MGSLLSLVLIMIAILVGGCVETGYQPTYIISHEPPAVEEVVPIEEEVR
jgi:hypothetical protein